MCFLRIVLRSFVHCASYPPKMCLKGNAFYRIVCISKMFSVPMESLDMKSKILSLELISMVLESSAHVFKASEKFINNAIKNFLCESLLINGKSSVARVFKLCLSICLSLMSHFREHLKVCLNE